MLRQKVESLNYSTKLYNTRAKNVLEDTTHASTSKLCDHKHTNPLQYTVGQVIVLLALCDNIMVQYSST